MASTRASPLVLIQFITRPALDLKWRLHPQTLEQYLAGRGGDTLISVGRHHTSDRPSVASDHVGSPLANSSKKA